MGTLKRTFKIVPKATYISSIKAGKNEATVKWNPVKGTAKYQVRYKEKTSKNWKVKTVSGKMNSTVFKKLKANKNYNFQVRSYQIVNKVTYYSKWSKVKTSKKIK